MDFPKIHIESDGVVQMVMVNGHELMVQGITLHASMGEFLTMETTLVGELEFDGEAIISVKVTDAAGKCWRASLFNLTPAE